VPIFIILRSNKGMHCSTYICTVNPLVYVICFATIILCLYNDKKENKIFLICKEIQMGSDAKLYLRKGFLIYEEMRKYLTIYDEPISHL
jgi:hypothetical protein